MRRAVARKARGWADITAAISSAPLKAIPASQVSDRGKRSAGAWSGRPRAVIAIDIDLRVRFHEPGRDARPACGCQRLPLEPEAQLARPPNGASCRPRRRAGATRVLGRTISTEPSAAPTNSRLSGWSSSTGVVTTTTCACLRASASSSLTRAAENSDASSTALWPALSSRRSGPRSARSRPSRVPSRKLRAPGTPSSVSRSISSVVTPASENERASSVAEASAAAPSAGLTVIMPPRSPTADSSRSTRSAASPSGVASKTSMPGGSRSETRRTRGSKRFSASAIRMPIASPASRPASVARPGDTEGEVLVTRTAVGSGTRLLVPSSEPWIVSTTV